MRTRDQTPPLFGALQRALAAELDLPHVRDVEQTGRAPHRLVLGHHPGVLDGHVPAGEVDHPRPERAVNPVERCLRAMGCGPDYTTPARAIKASRGREDRALTRVCGKARDEDQEPAQPLGPVLLVRVLPAQDGGGPARPPPHARGPAPARAGLRLGHLRRRREHPRTARWSSSGRSAPRASRRWPT